LDRHYRCCIARDDALRATAGAFEDRLGFGFANGRAAGLL
jgi:hypothetical protein